MRSQTAAILASLLSIVSAVPVATDTDECVIETATITAAPSSTSSCTVIVSTVLSTDVPSVIATLTSATVTTSAISGTNVQLFTGTLGGAPPPVVSGTGTRPFEVNGDSFVGEAAALGRSCDVQHNKCANAANSGQVSGGVAVCDAQNQACRGFNNVKVKARRNMPPQPVRRDLDLGTCSNPEILFESGLDGRNTPAFIAANQADFNHGSALNIGVIAGFICQRLGSSCSAAADVQATCSSASAAAVATTQNQAAADAFNSIMGVASASAVATTTAAATATAVATTAAATTSAPDECSVEVVTATATTPDLASTPVGVVAVTITSCV